MTHAVIDTFMTACLQHLHGHYVCPQACASLPFELIDTLHRLQLPVSVMVVMETMFGVTDVFVADQDTENHKGPARI